MEGISHEDLVYESRWWKMGKDLFILIDFIYDPCAINLSYILPSVSSRKQERVVQRVAQKRWGDHLSWLAYEIKPFEYLSMR